MYYLSSYKHEITDIMDLITEPLESKYLEKIKLLMKRDRCLRAAQKSYSAFGTF